MLSKQRRIPRRLFPEILAKGRRFNSPSLLLYALETNQKELSRFSFSVSKKVARDAVSRNTFRRRGYSIVREFLAESKPGFLCFFSFKKGAKGITFVVLQKEIPELLRSAGVIQ